MLRVLVLGELAVEHDGRTVPLPAGRPARTLLGYLALHPDRHARAELAARLWPDVLDESARTSLRGALADLRRALGPAADGHLEATREHVGLESVWTDAAAVRAGGPPGEALRLWRGELLAGLEAGDWLTLARDEYRTARGALLARLADQAAAAGDDAAAVAHARERVALEPLSEDAHRDLIVRLAASGDRGAAVSAYERLSERLRTELGVAPSGATRELVARLRAGDLGRRPAAARDASGDLAPLPPVFAARRERSPFVGREAERARLLAALDGVRGGDRRLLLMAGEPGIGKSRLVAEAARRAHVTGAVVLAGRCHEEPLGPFAPFTEALRPLGELRPEPAADPGAARLRLFDEVAAMLAEAARHRPVMLVLDDLHWADRATLRLLAHLAATPEPAALLIVGTYRHTDLGRRHPLAAVLADLRREPRTERMALAGLDAEATARLIGGWVGADAGPRLAGRVLNETEGNPFFIEEVLRDLLEGGALVRTEGRWQASGRLSVPESVREVIGRRVERLSDGAIGVLEAAAVNGRDFDVGVLAASGMLTRDLLLDGLEEAERAHLVRPAAGGERSQRWAFSHALVREALYDELPSSRRARLHAAVADGLVRTGGAPAEAAFHAYEAAALEGPRRAVALGREAAAEALAGLDYEAAATHLARAVEALELDAAADPLERADLLLERGDALARAADPEATAAFTAAGELARAAGDAERLGRAALGLGGLGVTIMTLDRDRAARLEEAIGALDARAPALRARLLARLAIELAYAPGRDRSGPLSVEAVACAREAGEPDALLAALNARHVALWHPDGLGERFTVAEEMIALAAANDRPEAELQGRNWRAVDLWEAGDLSGFTEELERHGALADALRLATFRWYAPMWRASLAVVAGEHARAARLIDEALAIGSRARDGHADLCAQMLRAQMAIQEQRFEDYDLAFVDERIAHSPAGPAYRGSRAWALAALGRPAEARADLDWLWAGGFARLPFDFNWLSAVGETAEAIALLGDAERAGDLYAIALPYSDRTLVAGRAICSQGSMHHYLGRLAVTAGRHADACEHYRAALEAQEGMGARAWSLQTRAWLAEALGLAGDGAASERELAAARAESEALGLPLPTRARR